MKRLAVWLSMMVCIFGSYQLYAAQSGGGGFALLVRYARDHNWPWWAFLLIGGVWACWYFSNRKK